MTPNGLITFTNVKLSAPQFTLYRGAGRYSPNGQFLFAGDGYSKTYGPITARVTGTAARRSSSSTRRDRAWVSA